MCYYCLFKFRWEPAKFLSLSKADKAYIAAAIEVYGETEEKHRKEIESKRRR